MAGAGIGLDLCCKQATNVYPRERRVKGEFRALTVPLLLVHTKACICHSNQPDDEVSRQAVLIISSDPVAAALLGAAVELAEHMPHFVGNGERTRAALLRVRPRLILVDCDHEEACTDEFVGPAIMTGARVVLFRSNRSIADRTQFSGRLGLRTLDMPKEHDSITALLSEMLDD